MRLKKVVIDTNIYISLLLNNELEFIGEAIILNDLEVFICKELLDEIKDVCKRDKIKKIVPQGSAELIPFLLKYVTYTEIIKAYQMAPDPDDNYLFDLAISVSADVIVTGDKILLKYKDDSPVKIIAFRDFKDYLKEN